MNYIGSKLKLSQFIFDIIKSEVGILKDKVFCDLFAGTGIIGRIFKPSVKQVISNDFEYYSYVLNKHYIENVEPLKLDSIFDYLNKISGKKGKIYHNYCLGGGSGRQYFSDENGKKIDSIRLEISKLLNNKKLSINMYFYLLTSLLEASDKVANTASVYASYLKKLKSSAQTPLILKPAIYEQTNQQNLVFCKDANKLIAEIQGDILYLDPPYNNRQYGNYYHILNSIAKYDNFIALGKSGMRDYQKSSYCSKHQVENSFVDLIKNAKFKYIFLSYNNEGLLSLDKIQKIMSSYGKYKAIEKKYQRFKADTDKNRSHKASYTIEYLHILHKK